MEKQTEVGVLLTEPGTLHPADEPRTDGGGAAADNGITIRQGSIRAGVGLKEYVAQVLRQLGYNGPLCCEEALVHSAELGAASQHFTSLCVWLVSELKVVSSMVENISPTEGPEDAETFQLEMSGVVNELHCPYTALTTGDVTCRLTNLDNCLQLLVFLSTELQAARIISNRKVPAMGSEGGSTEAVEELKQVGEAVGMPEHLLAVPAAEYMRMLQIKIAEITDAVPDFSRTAPLLKTELQPSQWEKLADLHWQLLREYECRMRMLVTRCDVTVQSFYWSERAKELGAAMKEVYWPLRQSLKTETRITMAHLLAAREEDSRILHTCSAVFRQNTQSSVNKVLMAGNVPDRGGRPNEIEPPMPTWTKRREGGGGQQWWGKRNKRRKK
ncbi:family with sequence similarity 98 member A L homeolog [Xenopus laevis]|uniref:Uncharacterized protein n=2 Tax=Xenopus laevis TaxID=8355 RepID=A0A974C7N3_XENLA|nr:uncharacterized protein LOC447202 [Xenopus laevis]AAH79692.1 MGC80361 protein [Xenopus laevis]OCT68077.1 hypothetical protein XELAEV_18039372mg [Xenopus laevis]OCT68078.1 hypothetical protein XELAEV_18039372mg [Xenopus laevis]